MVISLIKVKFDHYFHAQIGFDPTQLTVCYNVFNRNFSYGWKCTDLRFQALKSQSNAENAYAKRSSQPTFTILEKIIVNTFSMCQSNATSINVIVFKTLMETVSSFGDKKII